MTIRHATLPLLCLLTVYACKAPAEGAECCDDEMCGYEETSPAAAIDRVFAALVADAERVHALLGAVTDKESADGIVPEMEKVLADMEEKLHELEQYPFRSEKDAEVLSVNMATLTHVALSCLEDMQRLTEVNAYGSERLMGLFARYKLAGSNLPLHADDLPHTQLYNALADMLDDALYCLRNVNDEAGAAAAVAKLRPMLQALEVSHNMLVQLAPPRTDEQREAIRPARERLQRLSTRLKEQTDRLQAEGCYRNAELNLILPRLLQMASCS